jgi:hypothetical protein
MLTHEIAATTRNTAMKSRSIQLTATGDAVGRSADAVRDSISPAADVDVEVGTWER